MRVARLFGLIILLGVVVAAITLSAQEKPKVPPDVTYELVPVGQKPAQAPAPTTGTPAILQLELEARLQELMRGLEQADAALEQAKANVHAYNGAIQDCRYWLEQLAQKRADQDKAKALTPPKPASPPKK